ncbi:unnamed protein product [Orchesella dallaii]|uniref:Proline-rich transmembrane protein 3/4 domain-containing protein n=1 Tax=Orchesella dallaii TaxID=48710 RepID=A0ABP1QRG1_9HEXA
MCSTQDNTSVPASSDYFVTPDSDSVNCSDLLQLEEHAPYYTPELSEVKEEIRWGFMLHSYGFACMFFFLAFYAFFSILNLRSQLSTRPYMSTINSFLCLLGICRSGVLFIDPYGLQKTLPILLGSLLWELGYPCLISSFSLIQIAFLQLTQLDLGPERLRKKTCLSVVITVHFVSVIASAIYTNINVDLTMLKLITQLIFTIWGLFLFGSFLYAGKRVLGVMGGSGSSSNEGSSLTGHNDKGVANLFGMGLLGPGQNLASSLTAALAPTLLQSSGSTTASSSTPKIKITDENDRTVSVASDSSRINDNDGCGEGVNQPLVRSSTPVAGPSNQRQIDICEADIEIEQCSTASVSGNYARPPSPVLPRRKSSGSGVSRGIEFNPRTRLGLNRKDSGPGSDSSAEKEIRKKSLTWVEPEKEGDCSRAESEKSVFEKRRASRKSFDANSQNPSASESDRASIRAETLLTGGGPDYTLQSILSHIAYVNQTALDYRLSRKLSRKNQVHRVIKYTSLTAALGVLLCIMELIRIISPYGVFASTTTPPAPWPWFALQTCCRLVEIVMGATVANITKQPVSRPPHYAYSFRHKHHRESLYL